MRKTEETETAKISREIAEFGLYRFRPDIPYVQEEDEAAGWAFQQLKSDLAYQPADCLADAALKMGHLCRHLRDIINAGDAESVWAYRLAEGIHDDLESLTHHYTAMLEGRDPLAEVAA